MGPRTTDRFPRSCLLALAAWWALLAIAPWDRASWLHENLLVFLAVPALVRLHRRMPFSNVSCACLALFFALHQVGAHYTYSDVPLFERLADSWGLSRNHYDRVVHFSFGLLAAYPIRELFMRVASARGVWSYYLPLEVVMATSMLYELIEWGFVLVAEPSAGTAFLGAQGDGWDAQKDMALASLGALLAMTVVLAINARTDPLFRAELVESLRVKRKTPLGEVELRRRGLLDDRD